MKAYLFWPGNFLGIGLHFSSSMLIVFSSRAESDLFFRKASRLVILSCAGLLLLSMAAIPFFLRGKGMIQEESRPKMVVKSGRDYARIGSGPLSLDARFCSPFLAKVMDEIEVVGKNTRPDREIKNASYLVRLKEAQQERKLIAGEELYLLSDHPVEFSAKPTAIKIRATESDLEIVHEMEGGRKEVASLSAEENNNMKEKPYFAALQEAKWWTQDLFVDQCELCKPLKGKQKVDLQTGICFVSQGDFLAWDGKRWNVAPLPECKGMPLAKVQVSPKGIDITGWDETGYAQIGVSLSPQVPQRQASKYESVITSARVRSATQISCLIGKRRMILKKGDLILKTETGWRHVRTAADVEASAAARGEIFLFDGIDKDDGKTVAKGRMYDASHSQVTPMVATVTGEKKKQHNRRGARAK